MDGRGAFHLPMTAARRFATLMPVNLPQAGVAGLGLCAIALVWFGIVSALSAGREAAIDGAYRNAGNLTRVFEEALIRSINAVDQTLIQARTAYRNNPPGFDITAWASSVPGTFGQVPQMSRIDKNGFLADSNFVPAGVKTNMADRDYFQFLKQGKGDQLYITPPLHLRTSKNLALIFARGMTAADGAFDGVMLIAIDPEYLSRSYHAVDLGHDGVIVLIGEDGIWRARASASARTGHDMVGKAAVNSPILAAYAKAPEGSFAATAPADGISRLYAYRGVAGFPLVIAVGFAERDVLGRHDRDRLTYIVLGSILTALLLAATAALLLRHAQMHRARARLHADYADKSELLKRTLENMNQAIVKLDPAGRVQVFNQNLIDLLGLPESLLAAQPHFSEVLRWQWEHAEFGPPEGAFATWLEGFMVDRLASGWTVEHTRPNGTVLEVRGKALPDGGNVRTYTDVTERRRGEALLRAARDEAQRAARAKAEFLATMSHEIRSPMSGLLGVLELLRATPMSAEQEKMTGMVHNSAQMLLAVLNDILDFSKIEAGALSVTPEATALLTLLGDIVAPQIPTGLQKGIAVSLTVDPEVPDWVVTDGLRLRQIVGNLLSNAIKFTPAGQVAVNATVRREGAEAILCIAVRDSGIGMEAEVVERSFQPFMQADGSTTRRFGGTGLGLCISQQLARLLGGALSVTSVPGAGSVFTLDLPCLTCDSPVAATGDAAGTDTLARKNLRVLIVDDDPTNRWLGQRQLERLGLRADAAIDGESGFAAFLAARYDLVVTDCHMPGMDGVALTRAVRALADDDRCRVPIIGLTADATVEQREAGMIAGMTEVAIKPLTVERLSALVSRLTSAPVPAPPPPPAFDVARLRSVAFDDQIFLAIFERGDVEGVAWLENYAQAARQDVEEIAKLAASTPDAVTAVAHRLAGASFSAGAMLLGEAARVLERAAAAGEPLAVPLAAVDLHLDLAVEAIAAFTEAGLPAPA